MPRPGHRKSHCKKGHALTAEAVYTYHDKERRPARRCKTCKKDWERESARKRQLEKIAIRVKLLSANGKTGGENA